MSVSEGLSSASGLQGPRSQAGSSWATPAAPIKPLGWALPSQRVPFSIVRNKGGGSTLLPIGLLSLPEAMEQCCESIAFKLKDALMGTLLAFCIQTDAKLPMSSEIK